MLALVITACLADEPATCRRFELPIHEPVSAMTCMMQAPAEIARWHEGRAEWAIARWRCEAEPRERRASN